MEGGATEYGTPLFFYGLYERITKCSRESAYFITGSVTKYEYCSVTNCTSGIVVGFIAEKSGACCGKILVAG